MNNFIFLMIYINLHLKNELVILTRAQVHWTYKIKLLISSDGTQSGTRPERAVGKTFEESNCISISFIE